MSCYRQRLFKVVITDNVRCFGFIFSVITAANIFRCLHSLIKPRENCQLFSGHIRVGGDFCRDLVSQSYIIRLSIKRHSLHRYRPSAAVLLEYVLQNAFHRPCKRAALLAGKDRLLCAIHVGFADLQWARLRFRAGVLRHFPRVRALYRCRPTRPHRSRACIHGCLLDVRPDRGLCACLYLRAHRRFHRAKAAAKDSARAEILERAPQIKHAVFSRPCLVRIVRPFLNNRLCQVL